MFPDRRSYDDATIEAGSRWPRTACPCVEIERGARHGPWKPADHRRRAATTAGSPCTPRSPSTARPPATTCCAPPPTRRATRVLGTLSNCAGGTTPWGTVLSGEENFNQYFDASGAVDPAIRRVVHALRHRHRSRDEPRLVRRVDERFDLTKHPHEAVPLRLGRRGRPARPDSTPRQAHDARPLQARGRQRHDRRRPATPSPTWATTSAATTSTSSSRQTASDTGDSRAARKHNLTLLTKGTLYVAKFTGDGTARRRSSTARASGSPLTSRHHVVRRRDERRRGARLHPARRRQGRPDQDGPPRGRRAQPGQRQDLRRADQQLQPRGEVPDGRDQPARLEHGPRRARARR